jgi:hypothetical protein
VQAKQKPSLHKNDPAPNDTVPPLKETDKKDLAPNETVPPLKETDEKDPFDPETSQSSDSFDDLAIGKLGVSDDKGRENTPDDEVAVDESGDAKGKDQSMLL